MVLVGGIRQGTSLCVYLGTATRSPDVLAETLDVHRRISHHRALPVGARNRNTLVHSFRNGTPLWEKLLGTFVSETRSPKMLSALCVNGTLRQKMLLAAFANDNARPQMLFAAFTNDNARPQMLLAAFANDNARPQMLLGAFADETRRQKMLLGGLADEARCQKMLPAAFSSRPSRRNMQH